MLRLLLILLLCLSSLAGCATTQALPTASFYGLTVQTVQPDPNKPDIELKLGLDFQVKNPLGIKLIVPRHQFALSVGGERLGGSGTRQEFEVPKKGKKVVRYDFAFDLNQKTLGEALGAESTFAFTADADIDLPSHVLRTFDLDKSPVGGELGEIAKTLGGAIEEAARKGAKKGKGFDLKFQHEGRIKLPKLPKILPPDEGAKPKVDLVAGSGGGAGLGDVAEWMEPVVGLLDAATSGSKQHELRLPVADVLAFLGVPRNKAQTAVVALNTALSLTGGSRVGAADSTVPIRINLDVGKVLEGVQPQAKRNMERFLDGWRRNRTAFASLEGGFALPEGVAFSVPFRMNNPNQFPVLAPSFRFGLVDGQGRAIALIQMLPEAAKAGKEPESGAVLSIGAGKTASMELVSQVNWAALGLGIAAGGAPDLRLAGELSVDLGLGPLTVPFSFVLPPPPSAAPRESRTDSGREAPAPRREGNGGSDPPRNPPGGGKK